MALSDNVERKMMLSGYIVTSRSKENRKFFKGALVNWQDGKLVRASDTTGNYHYAGIVAEYVDAKTNDGVKIIRDCIVELPLTNVAESKIGDDVFATADDTISLTGTNVKRCGVIVGVPATNIVLVDTSKSL